MRIEAFPDNVPVEIDEIRNLGLEKNFQDPRSGVKLSVESFSLLNQAYSRMNTWLYNEQGRFENAPAEIYTNAVNGVETVYHAYINQKEMVTGFNRIECNIELRKSYGHFFEQAAGLTFELLHSKGGLPSSVITDTPYIIIPDDIRIQRAIAIVTSMSLAFQLQQTIKNIGDASANFADPAHIIAAGIKVALLVVFLLFTLLAFIDAANDLKELYFPTVRYLKSVRDFDLLKYACNFLGYTFESNMIELELYGMHTMGKPIPVDNESSFQLLDNDMTEYFNKGYPTAGDSTPTLDLFIQHYLDTYDCLITVFDGVVRIEREATFSGNASFVLDPTLSDQTGHDNQFKYNDEAAWGRKYDHWADDYSDSHSIEVNRSMKSEYITEPINVINQDLFHLTGLKENAAPFAPAQIKRGYTGTELFLAGIFVSFDQIINLLGGNSNFTGIITERKFVMIMEKQYFSVTKKLWGVPQQGILKQSSNFNEIMSMNNIHNVYNLGKNVINNNFKIESMTVPFTDESWQNLLQNYFVIWKPTGESVKVLNAVWLDKQYKAELIVQVPDGSAFNTKTTKLA